MHGKVDLQAAHKQLLCCVCCSMPHIVGVVREKSHITADNGAKILSQHMLAATTVILQLFTTHKDSFMTQINSPLSPSSCSSSSNYSPPPHSPSRLFRFIMSTSNICFRLVKKR